MPTLSTTPPAAAFTRQRSSQWVLPLASASAGVALIAAVAGLLAPPPSAAAPLASPAPSQSAPTIGLSERVFAGQPVTLVYPASAPATTLTYGPFTLQVAREAEPLPGVRRLVVLSHGTGGSAVSDHELAATLARRGFVVAQPLHGGDNYRDTTAAGPASWRRRPDEVRRTIDALAADAQWSARLKLDRVGVHGTSAGGVTALALAGARWRMLDLVRHCLANAEADAGFCFNGLVSTEAQARRRAEFERARGVPEVFLPADLKASHGGREDRQDPRPDPRVAAVTLAVPVAAIFDSASLAGIRIPVGVVAAGADRWLVPAFHSDAVLRHVPRAVGLARLAAAAHMDLMAPMPEEVVRSLQGRQPQGAELAAGFDPAERRMAFERVAQFMVERLER